MKLINRAGSRLATLVLAGLLCGCVTLLPKEKPVQLYRFGGGASAAPAAATAGSGFTVRAVVGSFVSAAAGDQILTVTGNRAAYIAGARWVASARSLFETALDERFADAAGPARLMDRGELSAADARLDLAVTRFETLYGGGTPEVEVRIDASLDDIRGPGGRKTRVFEVTTPATANRQSAIVAAYGQSVSQVLSQLITWVNAKGSA